mgnify:CR=1 FL=1
MATKKKGAGGRPSKFTIGLGDKICQQIASGMSLRSVCLPEDMPERHTVIRWVLGQIDVDGVKEFSTQYTQAREAQYELMFDECLDIADDASNDYMKRQRKDGTEYDAVDNEVIQRSKMRIDTRLTILERMKPKKYGKTETVDHKSTDGTMSPPPTVIELVAPDIDED